MKVRIFSATLAALTLHVAGAGAAPSQGPKIAGHLTAYTTKAICTTAAPKPPCNPGETHLVTQGSLNTAYNLYLVVLDGDSSTGVAGAAFGVDYNGTAGAGMDAYSWTLCADAQYSAGPSGVAWPEPGSGNLIVWEKNNKCQQTSASGDADGGVIAVLGSLYVYAYSADLFSITKRNYANIPDLGVANCVGDQFQVDYPNAVGKVGFGTTQGVDPCQ